MLLCYQWGPLAFINGKFNKLCIEICFLDCIIIFIVSCIKEYDGFMSKQYSKRLSMYCAKIWKKLGSDNAHNYLSVKVMFQTSTFQRQNNDNFHYIINV